MLHAINNEHSKPRFFIGVACKEHVAAGVEQGICQFCHGKSSPCKRLRKGDFIIYYSSKMRMGESSLYQKFTAIGCIANDEAYSVDMGDGFIPYRRKMNYFECDHLDIKSILDTLSFIKNKKSWGYVFRYGFFEIDFDSFKLIADGMNAQIAIDSIYLNS